MGEYQSVLDHAAGQTDEGRESMEGREVAEIGRAVRPLRAAGQSAASQQHVRLPVTTVDNKRDRPRSEQQ